MAVVAHLFQRLPTTLHDAVCNLDCGHPPRERCASIAVCNVADVLQTQLTSIKDASQGLQHLFGIITAIGKLATYFVRLDTLHGMLHHYSSVQELFQHPSQQPPPDVRFRVDHSIRRN